MKRLMLVAALLAGRSRDSSQRRTQSRVPVAPVVRACCVEAPGTNRRCWHSRPDRWVLRLAWSRPQASQTAARLINLSNLLAARNAASDLIAVQSMKNIRQRPCCGL